MFRENTPVVIVEKKDHVAYLTLNRPDMLNALSFELLTGGMVSAQKAFEMGRLQSNLPGKLCIGD